MAKHRLPRLTLRRMGLNVAASMPRLGLSILHYPKQSPTIGWLLSQSKILLSSYQRLTVLFCHNTSSLLTVYASIFCVVDEFYDWFYDFDFLFFWFFFIFVIFYFLFLFDLFWFLFFINSFFHFCLILFFSGPLVRAAEPLHDNPANHHTRRRRGERKKTKKTKLYVEP